MYVSRPRYINIFNLPNRLQSNLKSVENETKTPDDERKIRGINKVFSTSLSYIQNRQSSGKRRYGKNPYANSFFLTIWAGYG
jgi:hypothetical protein